MRLLLIDTCGDVGSLAFAENGTPLRERKLPPRTASALLVADLRTEMGVLGWSLQSLGGIGVVSGPGSFTGVRVGLAAAKGLCEVAGVPLVTISRLELLLIAGKAMAGDHAVLDAGRGEFYVRSAMDGEELLVGRDELLAQAAGGRVLIAESKLEASFERRHVALIELSAAEALPLIERGLQSGGRPVDLADANYVRQARGLYAPVAG